MQLSSHDLFTKDEMTTHRVAQFTTVSMPGLYWHRHNTGAFVIPPKYTEMGVAKNKYNRRGKIILRAVAALMPASRSI